MTEMFRSRIAIHRFRYIYTASSSSSSIIVTCGSQFQCPSPHRYSSSAPKQDLVGGDEHYPSGDFEFKPVSGWEKLTTKLKVLTVFPWERLEYGTILTIKLRGQISDKLKSRFNRRLTLPQLCDNFLKAAYIMIPEFSPSIFILIL